MVEVLKIHSPSSNLHTRPFEMMSVLLHLTLNCIVESYKRLLEPVVKALQKEYPVPSDERRFSHQFLVNQDRNPVFSTTYWNLPIVQVTSLSSEGDYTINGWPHYCTVLCNVGISTSTGCTKYVVALDHMFPCVMYVEKGGVPVTALLSLSGV